MMAIFVLLTRPEWCILKGTNVNYTCNKSLDPNDPKEYVITQKLFLNEKTKMGVCMASMTILLGVMLLRLKITQGNSQKRALFYCNLLVTVLYAIFYWLKVFDIYTVPMTDLLVVTSIVLVLENVQKAFLRAIKVFMLTKEIIFFLLVFALILGIILRILMSREEDMYDDNISPFYTYNYTTFGKALYSTFIISLGGGDVAGPMMLFYNVHWYKFAFWMLIFIFVKFLLPNFLIGAMTAEYMNLYQIEIVYVTQYPKITKDLKQLIHQDRYSN